MSTGRRVAWFFRDCVALPLMFIGWRVTAVGKWIASPKKSWEWEDDH